MANTPESKVKKKVTELLKLWDAYYFYPVTGGYGRSGVPDIVACIQGEFIGIECKAGKGTTTELQKKNLDAIRHAAGRVWVINETQIEAFELWLISHYGFRNGFSEIVTATTVGKPRKLAKKATKKAVKKAVKKVAK